MTTHPTLKGETLLARSIFVGFVDDTSFVLITKGKTQMLKLCISLEGQQAKMRPGKTEFLATKAVGRWLDMDGGGEENTKQNHDQ